MPRDPQHLGHTAPSAHPYHSLEDFLIAALLTPAADAGSGDAARAPANGRLIAATVLVADVTAFSARTAGLDPSQALAYANRCFDWITAEALAGRPGIVDRCTDGATIVFSREFGSADPFVDALRAARRLARSDTFPFMSRVGIASGEVAVGYVGSARSYTCSVFGATVALAARCADVSPRRDGIRASISFPASEWGDRRLADLFPPQREGDGAIAERPPAWRLLDAAAAGPGDAGTIDVRHLVCGADLSSGNGASATRSA